ncbi:MAG: hypothetical protein QNK05_05025 [Myxococcota bacterium]|nr:hypothetical protein [Myxococcota bacterium]
MHRNRTILRWKSRKAAAWLLGVGIALATGPAIAAPPQPFSMACPHHVTSELYTLPLQDWEAPSGWSQETQPYGYLFANLPLLKASGQSGQLHCDYGVAMGNPFDLSYLAKPAGYRLVRIRKPSPRGFWCSPRNEKTFIGFDCTPW